MKSGAGDGKDATGGPVLVVVDTGTGGGLGRSPPLPSLLSRDERGGAVRGVGQWFDRQAAQSVKNSALPSSGLPPAEFEAHCTLVIDRAVWLGPEWLLDGAGDHTPRFLHEVPATTSHQEGERRKEAAEAILAQPQS